MPSDELLPEMRRRLPVELPERRDEGTDVFIADSLGNLLDAFALGQPFPRHHQAGALTPLGKGHAGFTGEMAADAARADFHALCPFLDAFATYRIGKDFARHLVKRPAFWQHQTSLLL